MTAVLVRGGRVIDPAQSLDADRDILFGADGLVAAIDLPGKLAPAAKKLRAAPVDASGCIVASGLIDLHTHLREPGQAGKETIATGTRAAVAGGFTAVCAMPNTAPVNDSAEWTRWMQAAERGAMAQVFPVAAATRASLGESVTDYEQLKKAGAVAVSDDGKPILEDEVMRVCLQQAARAGMPVIQHAEDTRRTAGCSMNAGALAFRLGLRGYTTEAEAAMVRRDLALLASLDRGLRRTAHLHVAHVSTAAALDVVRRAKSDGLPVTCEVAPHHFTLGESAVEDYNTHAKMYPPLRSEQDRQAMIEGLVDGTVDAIATDHAPHAIHEKQQEFERAPNGILGLETALALAVQVLHYQHGLPLPRILALLSAHPARIIQREHERGHLRVGAAGGAVIFAPADKWTYHADHGASLSRNSPFNGWELPARIHAVVSLGKVISRSEPS